MFTFLKGRPYRLILFGGRRELFVDDAIKYRNNGQWTDFYFAFDKARELVEADYPPGADLRLVLITDAILDPSPADWADMNVPEGVDLKAHVVEKTLALIKEMNIPLYVILVGEPPDRVREGQPGARARPDPGHGAGGERQEGRAVRAEHGRLLLRQRRPAQEVRVPGRAPGGPEEDRAHRHAHLHARAPGRGSQFLSALILPLAPLPRPAPRHPGAAVPGPRRRRGARARR